MYRDDTTDIKKNQSRAARYLKDFLDIGTSPKIIALLQKEGWTGVGLWGELRRRLAAEASYRMKLDFDLLAFSLRADAELIQRVIENYDLFVLDDEGAFYAPEVTEEMKYLDEKRENLSANGKKGGNAKASALANAKANAMANALASSVVECSVVECNGMKTNGMDVSETRTHAREGDILFDEILELWQKKTGQRKPKLTQDLAKRISDCWEYYPAIKDWERAFSVAQAELTSKKRNQFDWTIFGATKTPGTLGGLIAKSDAGAAGSRKTEYSKDVYGDGRTPPEPNF